MRTRIFGTGSALPSIILTNKDLESRVDTSDEWIVERTGIRARRILENDRCTSDLATEAARKACEAAGWDPATLDCIVLATVTPDMPMPSTANFVQAKLGCTRAASFDLSAACAGFVFGLSVADSFIRARQFRRVCVIGVEILSRILDWKDRNTCVLFGDGAGAVVLGPELDDSRGIFSTHIFSDGTGAEHLQIPGGGSRQPTSHASVESGSHNVKMNGRQVFTAAVRNISAACEEALRANELTPTQIDHVVAHQANIRIIESVAERCGLPMSKFFLNLERYGNTSSASIPIALDELVRSGNLKQNDAVLLCALGAGFNWGSALIRW